MKMNTWCLAAATMSATIRSTAAFSPATTGSSSPFSTAIAASWSRSRVVKESLRGSLSTIQANGAILRGGRSISSHRGGSCLFMSTKPASPRLNRMPPKPQPKVPITLLSGFLGAGKTCTLQHLLKNTDGVKIGVIVNDVANVNIDAKLVSGSNNGVVELQNGCACCSLADELLGSVSTLLSDDRKFDALVVELSGVADPIAIKQNWKTAEVQGHPVTNRADISQVVTLIDASTFGTDWMTWDVASERDGWVDPADECAGQRNVPELLAEQVEAADVILINKVDLAGDNVEVATTLARTLNDKAVIEKVEFGKVSPHLILKQILDDNKSEPTSTTESCQDSETHSDSCHDPDCADPTHDHGDAHDVVAKKKNTSTDALGIVNFVYKADRPFNPKKLMALLNQWPVPIKDELDLSLLKEAQEEGYEVESEHMEGSPFIGVLRSKGFCWFAPTKWTGPSDDVWRHDTVMYWSHAGKHFGISSAGKWWGTISKEQMAKFFKEDIKEFERIISEDFVTEEFGDRRQELVFIGVGLKEEDITAALDQCLLTDKGMDRYRQELRNFMSSIYTQPAGGSDGGLFDVGGYDNMDLD